MIPGWALSHGSSQWTLGQLRGPIFPWMSVDVDVGTGLDVQTDAEGVDPEGAADAVVRALTLRRHLHPGSRRMNQVRSPGKVSVDIERRKKKAGDEAKSWALTAMTKTLLDLEPSARDRAIQVIAAMLDSYGFEVTATQRVQKHAEAAREKGLDEEELIERLTELLNVAAYSDGFGFDLLGWIPDASAHGGGHPMALEVKSASGSFFFSSGEWACIERMRGTAQTRPAYALLTVRRQSGSDAPVAMDLLVDPVYLWESGQKVREDDTYRMRYAPIENIPGRRVR